MEGELGLDIVPWLKSDLLSGFSDLLDSERMAEPDAQKHAATLGAADLLSVPTPASNVDLSTDQASHADWLKGLMAGVVMPPQPANDSVPKASEAQPFPGFPAAGLLSASFSDPCTAPVSCSRFQEDATLTPSSWDSNLSTFSLESSLVELPSVPEPPSRDLVGRRLKSENSFACSELDSFNGSQDASKEETKGATAINSKPSLKASMADRNRERQQRFRQRQKAKIETLEQQVSKLTAQTRALCAEKEDLSGRAAKLADLLQARDRALLNVTSQLSQLRCGGSGEQPENVQLTLTYCSPPLLLNKAQMQSMSAGDLAKLWKEYVWQLSQILAKEDDFQGQWTRSSERLDALTSELIQLMMHLWDCCPEFARIKATGLVDESQPQEDSYSRWQMIASSLALQPEQVQSLLALRNSMRIRLRQIWAQRREVHTLMQSCLEEDLASSRDIALQHLKVKQNKEIMDEGLKQEGLLARDFEFALYKKVLRPDQRAMCMVRAFPFFPDSQALANWVAASHGDLEAQGMMTMHSTSSTTSYHSNS